MQNSNSILELAINAVVANHSFDNTRVVELLNYARLGNADQALRAVLYITGQLNLPECKKAVIHRDRGFCTFQSYDIFGDEVTYEYDDADHRVFKTQEDADKYAKTGQFSWDKSESSSKTSDTYPFLGKHEHKSTGHCSFEDWDKLEAGRLQFDAESGEFKPVEDKGYSLGA